tara:strand:+ start:30778 stop:31020 length:243 start_codon:yes stop_codon:yes gene_type:complete
MTQPTKEELKQLQNASALVASAMTTAMFNTKEDKRACTIGALRAAAGVARASEVSLHNAIHLFMTYYKDAEKHFEGKSYD